MSSFFGYISLKNSEYSHDILKNALTLIKKRSNNSAHHIHKNYFHINADDNNSYNLLLDHTNTFLINFTGRIDNRFDIFTGNKISFKDDAKNVLNLFLNDRDSIKNLSGPFAFTIQNIKTNEIYIYRDQMGQKPIYYFINDEKLLYSTEPNFIFSDIRIKKILNKEKIKHFILKGSRLDNETFYKDIYRLRRSSYIQYRNNLVIRKYFEFQNEPTIEKNSNQEYAEEFFHLFKKIISAQMVTNNNKVSAMLSGGLDTSSIVSTISSQLNDNNIQPIDFKTYSITFRQLKKIDFDKAYETNYIKDVIQKYKINSSIINLDFVDVQSELSKIQANYPEPNYHGNKYMDFAIINQMKIDQQKVILSGFDGDSVISHGESYLYELLNKAKYKEFLNEIKKRNMLRGNKNSFLKILKSYLLPFILPNFIYYYKDHFLKRLPAQQTSRFLNKECIKSLPINEMSKRYISSRKDYSNFHLNTLNTNVWEHVFEIQDIDYGRNKMEVRYPFMDKRLIEFCLKLPSSQKMQNGISRFILREAMSDILPTSIYQRMDKSILSPYYDYSFDSNFEKMKKEVLSKDSYLEDILDYNFIKKLDKRNITLNESIIFQHIYILRKWLDFKQFDDIL